VRVQVLQDGRCRRLGRHLLPVAIIRLQHELRALGLLVGVVDACVCVCVRAACIGARACVWGVGVCPAPAPSKPHHTNTVPTPTCEALELPCARLFVQSLGVALLTRRNGHLWVAAQQATSDGWWRRDTRPSLVVRRLLRTLPSGSAQRTTARRNPAQPSPSPKTHLHVDLYEAPGLQQRARTLTVAPEGQALAGCVRQHRSTHQGGCGYTVSPPCSPTGVPLLSSTTCQLGDTQTDTHTPVGADEAHERDEALVSKQLAHLTDAPNVFLPVCVWQWWSQWWWCCVVSVWGASAA
jgi:hypothetical protein